MNLSPEWVQVFSQQGWGAEHWSTVGDPRAPDRVLMEWARISGSVVFTHDLDFGALLSATGAVSPSVVQLRAEDVRPAAMAQTVITAMRMHRLALEQGALLTIDPRRSRVLVLPFKRS